MSWYCLTSGDERSALKTLGYARNDDAREALSKLRGASDFYAPHHHFSFRISNFSFKRSFQTELKGSTPKGLTLNPEPPFLCYNKGNATWAAVASKEGKDET